MDDLGERVRLAVEGLLENESLTAGLTDETAQRVLDWGLTWTQEIVRSTAGLDEQVAQEVTYAQLKATRRLMRDVSRFLVALAQGQTAELFPLLDTLVAYAAEILGPDWRPPLPEERQAFLEQVGTLGDEPARLVTALRHFLTEGTGLQAEAGFEAEAALDAEVEIDEPEIDSDYW